MPRPRGARPGAHPGAGARCPPRRAARSRRRLAIYGQGRKRARHGAGSRRASRAAGRHVTSPARPRAAPRQPNSKHGPAQARWGGARPSPARREGPAGPPRHGNLRRAQVPAAAELRYRQRPPRRSWGAGGGDVHRSVSGLRLLPAATASGTRVLLRSAALPQSTINAFQHLHVVSHLYFLYFVTTIPPCLALRCSRISKN